MKTTHKMASRQTALMHKNALRQMAVCAEKCRRLQERAKQLSCRLEDLEAAIRRAQDRLQELHAGLLAARRGEAAAWGRTALDRLVSHVRELENEREMLLSRICAVQVQMRQETNRVQTLHVQADALQEACACAQARQAQARGEVLLEETVDAVVSVFRSPS